MFKQLREDLKTEAKMFGQFWQLQGRYWSDVGMLFLGWAVAIKDVLARLMYRQRGRFSQSFVNMSMALIFFTVIVFSGKLEELIANNSSGEGGGTNYLLASANGGEANTLISDLPKGEVTEYRVVEGDTVSSIAQKFGVTIDTIVWENKLKSVDAIKPQQILRILPETGIGHKVVRGETIYSIAKKYQVDAQNIIDYPFNSFTNDETFALAAGQDVFIPDGVKPDEVIIDTLKYLAKTVAPIPGVVGEGRFMWPTSGRITQKFYWYHPGVDIANSSNPDIVASQGGTVVTAGWNGGGYGNYVIIDHGNGYRTLYGHMLNNSMAVKAGDRVRQGQKLGVMGSTGRSTGTHLHFEVRKYDGGRIDPLSVLK
ncbi:M23 family metallopeptidase [Candidatus Shapirobacteria bacterium]|nr:M23 family metallopeptidase [Candidatus Shapirobacteria bacterium]